MSLVHARALANSNNDTVDAQVLPSLREALELADEVAPLPSRAHGALLVLRSALAHSMGIDERILVEGATRHSLKGLGLDAYMSRDERLILVDALLNVTAGRLRVGVCYLDRDDFADLIWGVDETGTQCVAAVGTTRTPCAIAVMWALERSLLAKQQDMFKSLHNDDYANK